MFSYYGSKSKIVNLYPRPQYGRIIEPFAGSARYSLQYFENEIELYDLSEYVYEVWKYLIAASEKDVMSLPDVPSKKSLDDYKQLTDAERYLIGFNLCRGKARPRKIGHGQNNWANDKIRIANSLYKIRHWHIAKKSYIDLDTDVQATWFIDPPYIVTNQNPKNGDRYNHWNVDYDYLGIFANRCRGLVICCEGAGADYLPFKLLTTVSGNTNNLTVNRNQELVYIQRADLPVTFPILQREKTL